MLVACLVKPQTSQPIFTTSVYAGNVEKILVLFDEIYMKKSIIRQINDFCFVQRIFYSNCLSITEFVSQYVSTNTLHVYLKGMVSMIYPYGVYDITLWYLIQVWFL